MTRTNQRALANWPNNAVSVLDFGAVGDGVTDDTAAIQAAINASTTYSGTVFLPSGTYLVSSEIKITIPGITLQGAGAGAMRKPENADGTTLLGSHANGSVIRVMAESVRLVDIRIDSTAGRKGAALINDAADFNGGIRVEGADVVPPAKEGDVFNTNIERCLVMDQPNTGIYLVGRIYSSKIADSYVTGCAGHGIDVDDGALTSRVNLVKPGILNIDLVQVSDCGGHGIKIGSNSHLKSSFRINISNSEGFYNCNTPALLLDDANIFINCDGAVLSNAVSTGIDLGGTLHGGFSLAGRGGSVLQPRILDVSTPIIVNNWRTDGFVSTTGWLIDVPHVFGTPTSAFLCDLVNNPRNVEINAADGTNLPADIFNYPDIPPSTDFFGGRAVQGRNSYSYQQEFHRMKNIFSAEAEFNASISSDTVGPITVTNTPQQIYNVGLKGCKYKVSGFHSSDTPLSSFDATVIGGATTPIIQNVVNADGAGTDYELSIVGTDLYIAVLPPGTVATRRTVINCFKEYAEDAV